MTIRVSKSRINLEDSRLERATMKDCAETVQTVVSAATTTIDISLGNVIRLEQYTNITTLNITNPSSSGTTCSITIIRQKDNSIASRTITWPQSFRWYNSATPTLTQIPNAVDYINAVTTDGGTVWLATFSGGGSIPTGIGTIWSWGYNGEYVLGQGGGTTDHRSSPVQIGALGSWCSVATGRYHALALRTDGTLWVWGSNNYSGTNYGQLGTGDVNNRNAPVQVAGTTWSAVAAGGFHSVALRSDGTLWTWGNNANGELGLGSVVSKSSPVQVGTGTSWLAVAAGYDHSLALKSDGTMWAWGKNLYGQLGDASVVSKSTPVQVGTGTTWLAIVAGDYYSLGLKSAGTLWSWGYNNSGQLADGSTNHKSTPVQVGALTTWSAIAAGPSHGSGLQSDGTLWTWGAAGKGQLGNGSTTDRSSPVQVAGTTWGDIATGVHFVAARRTDGTLWAWGWNEYGQLGDNSTTDRSSPVQVAGTTWEAVSVSCAGEFMVAIKE